MAGENGDNNINTSGTPSRITSQVNQKSGILKEARTFFQDNPLWD
jgi:hypothetical protein